MTKAHSLCNKSSQQFSLFGPMTTIAELLSTALALGADRVGDFTPLERQALQDLPAPSAVTLDDFTSQIRAGSDPLGESYCEILSAERRRPLGATYTPPAIVESMLEWASGQLQPDTVIDPGAGSGRFVVAAGRRFPNAGLVAVECDPIPAILLRAHLATAGLADRAAVIVGDFRNASIPRPLGRALFIGNPPYVRHHLISPEWKQWLVRVAATHGYRASQLAGLHVHFFMAILHMAKPGDVGALITAAEWLDVNYGRLLRELMVGELGGSNMQIIEPDAMPFPGTATTAVISGFEVASKPLGIGFRRVASQEQLGSLATDRFVGRDELIATKRWTQLSRARVAHREGFVELGELCRVHRGQVTGASRIWIEGPHSSRLPKSVLYRAVTRAQELFLAGSCLYSEAPLKRVIDIPPELDALDLEDRSLVVEFLEYARSQGGSSGFIASHRRAWWSVGLREPAPILATYMARRPPAFVLNLAGARHINVAHGLYPRGALSDRALANLAHFLSTEISTNSGRTYAGGLTKFEPKEMERLPVPSHEALSADTIDWTTK